MYLEVGIVAAVAGAGEPGGGHVAGGTALEIDWRSPWDLAMVGRNLHVAMAGCHQIWTMDLDTHVLQATVGTGTEAMVELASRSAGSGDALPEALRVLTDQMRTRPPSEVLREGTNVANRFEYPDGKRLFRILKCQLNDGTMTLPIEPLKSR